MDMSKLSASDRRILITGVIAALGGVISIVDAWGIGGILGGLAGLGAVLVVLQPQLMPTMVLPAPRSTSLLVLGGIAAIGFALSALQYIGFVFNFLRIYTILFDIALVAAIALAYFAWLDYQASAGSRAPAAGAPPAPPAVEPPAAES